MWCILQTLQEVNTVNNILEVIGNTEQSKRAAEVSWIKRGESEGEEKGSKGERWLAQLAAIVLWCFCVIVAVFPILHNSRG